MSSSERLKILGLLHTLKEDERKLCAKIEGASELVRSHCSTILNKPYDQMEDEIIESIPGSWSRLSGV